MPQRVIRHTKDPEIQKLKKRVQELEGRKVRAQTERQDTEKKNHRERDLFICHATEDKEEIVRPLVQALIDVGFSVWYDEFALKLGDHLRRSIDKGLAQSRYGLVILSPNFFAKEWPQRELDGLTAKELGGEKVILPVWHKVDREYVMRFSPTLADRLAVSTEEGIDKVIEEVLKVVEPSKNQVSRKVSEEESTIDRLDRIINSIRGKNEESIKNMVKQMEFSDLKHMFSDVLDGIAFLDLPRLPYDKSVFSFISLAILQRNRKEGTELFEELLNWFFQTVTPSCKSIMLEMLAYLTRLSHLKGVVTKTNTVGSFVAEFGSSNSYIIAGINSEILQNIKSFLSPDDCRKIVDFALSNDQILFSWRANDYLRKVLSSCEGKADPARMEELYEKLAKHM